PRIAAAQRNALAIVEYLKQQKLVKKLYHPSLPENAGHEHAATIKTSLNYGVVDYLIKPFQFARFEEALTGWRQKKSLM
ncbi:PLP-dependent transferase, partial [Pantoea agglomerans]|uniref:PLP-dependent transferase n=1 Tax=Enterobacter agglomerans TaxID=549 RepID=UPI001F5C84E4